MYFFCEFLVLQRVERTRKELRLRTDRDIFADLNSTHCVRSECAGALMALQLKANEYM